jgi:hypothetical protein
MLMTSPFELSAFPQADTIVGVFRHPINVAGIDFEP